MRVALFWLGAAAYGVVWWLGVFHLVRWLGGVVGRW
jgi:hypothetical protein